MLQLRSLQRFSLNFLTLLCTASKGLKISWSLASPGLSWILLRLPQISAGIQNMYWFLYTTYKLSNYEVAISIGLQRIINFEPWRVNTVPHLNIFSVVCESHHAVPWVLRRAPVAWTTENSPGLPAWSLSWKPSLPSPWCVSECRRAVTRQGSATPQPRR